MHDPQMLEVAHLYAARFHLRVVPIRPGSKAPDLADWPRLATTDPVQIADWWTNGHAGCGVGIATGAESGVFVLDVDDNGRDKRGGDSLDDLLRTHGELPETPLVLTPGGGLHYYWRWPGFALKETLGPWLDIRAEGRQVLAPPSIHPNGKPYIWEAYHRPSVLWPPAEAPEWMLAALRLVAAEASEALDPLFALALSAAGFALYRTDAQGNEHWSRPGKNPREGASLTVYPDGHATCYSTNVPELAPQTPYTAQDLAAALGYRAPALSASAAATEAPPPPHFALAPAASIKPRRQRWLWRHRVPLGGGTLLVGQEGLGKSGVACDLAAKVTQGAVEDSDLSGPASVVYVTAEDSEASTLVPRLMAAGADLNRVFFPRIDGLEGGLMLPRDLPVLKGAMEAANARLLILDPFTVHIGDDKTDAHKERDVRRALAPLAVAMDELAASAIGIMHWNKGVTLVALDRVLGSRAFTAAARAVLGIGVDPSDATKRLLLAVKSNLGPQAPAGIAFTVEGRLIPDPEGGLPIETSGIAWAEDRPGVRSSDLFSVGEPREAGATDLAEAFLIDALAPGDIDPHQLEKWRKEVGGFSVATMRVAKKKLGVRSYPRQDENGRILGWMVSLPTGVDAPSRTTCQSDADEHLDAPPLTRDDE